MRLKEGNKEKDIIEAAVKVFAEDGFYKAKISKIARLADVATGSVYVYFKNKDALLITIFKDLWEKLYLELKSITANKKLSPIEKIDSMLDLVFDIFTENPSLAIVFVNEQLNWIRTGEDGFIDYYERFLDEGEKVLKEGIREKVFSDNLDLNIFRYYIFGAIRNLLHHWAISPKTFPLNKIRQHIKYLTKHGILKV